MAALIKGSFVVRLRDDSDGWSLEYMELGRAHEMGQNIKHEIMVHEMGYSISGR